MNVCVPVLRWTLEGIMSYYAIRLFNSCLALQSGKHTSTICNNVYRKYFETHEKQFF